MGYFADRNVVRNKSREGRFEKISGYENRNKKDTGQTQKGGRDGFIHDRDLLRGELCGQCEKLKEYTTARTMHCPFMETKTFCSACKVHCYSKEMQEEIRKVMRYAGPRMLFVHPVLAIRHVKVTLQNKRKQADS